MSGARHLRLTRGPKRAVLTLDQIIVLIYLRVSSHEQAESGLSLPNQLRDVRRYCARQADWIAGDVFQDILSGKRDDRPGYQALLASVRAHALAGRRVMVVVQRLDRLGRSSKERANCWDELEALGAEIHSDAEGKPPRFIYDILAATAQEEIRVLGDRVKRVWAGLDEGGWHHPGRVAWGYDTRERTPEEYAARAPKKVLVPHVEHAAYARDLWRRYAGGEPMESLIRWTAALPEAAKGARRLHGSAVRLLLKSPVYIGRLGGPHDFAACIEAHESCPVLDEPHGRWDPLIDEQTWQSAHWQYRAARRLPAQARGEYLLSGLIRCPACGGRMVGNPGNRKRAERDNYRGDPADLKRYLCSARLHGTDEQRAAPCYATVLCRKIDEVVIGTIGDMLDRASDRSLTSAMMSRYERDVAAAGKDDTGRTVARREQDVAAKQKMISRASQEYFAGSIQKIAYDAVVADLGEQVALLEAEIAELRARGRRPAPMPIEALLGAIAAWAEGFRTAPITTQRAALAEIVEWVRPVRVGRGRYELTWLPTRLGSGVLACANAGESTANLVALEQFSTTNYWTATQPPTTEPARASA